MWQQYSYELWISCYDWNNKGNHILVDDAYQKRL